MCVTFVALNFTIMRDYKKHLTLLPHKWQAGALFAAVLLAVVYYVGVFYNIRNMAATVSSLSRMYLWGMVSCLVTIALMIACLSKEKVEDEYITSVRYRALTITIFLFFMLSIISNMMYGSFHNIVFNPLFVGHPFTDKLIVMASFRKILGVIRILGSTHFLMLFYIILLKVLIHKGSGNGYKSILLPYSYKKIGWYIFLSSLVIVPFLIYMFCHFWNGNLSVLEVYETHVMLFRLLILIPYIGLLFICLSKEKQEDEFIRHIRARILVYFAIFSLIIGMINCIADNALQIYLINTPNNRAYVPMIMVAPLILLSRFPWVPVIYALVLKKVLSNYLKESNDEE